MALKDLHPADLGAMYRAAVAAEFGAGGDAITGRYRHDPWGFLVDVLKIDPLTLQWSRSSAYAGHIWDGTADPLLAALEAIADDRWVAVSSGTGTGKTFLMAAILLWWLASGEDTIAVTVATKEDQMLKGVWREVDRLWPAFQRAYPHAEKTTGRIRMRAGSDTWAAWTVTAQVGAEETSATGVQGLHAPRLLILVDETPGVPQAIMTALEQTATDPGNVIAAFGNPDHAKDALGLFAGTPGVVPVRISALDHPNVVLGSTLVPGAVSRASIARRAEKTGIDSPLYLSRVRGLAPEQSADALVRREWIVAAVARAAAWLQAGTLAGYPPAFGVDPANSDEGDPAGVARFLGPCCVELTATPCPNGADLGMRVWLNAQAVDCPPENIGVDAIGVGATTVNEMRRLMPWGTSPWALHSGGAPMQGIQRGEEDKGWSSDDNRFLNLRAQMWWQLREDLRAGRIGLPDDAELADELVQVKWEPKNGKVVVQDKKVIRTLLGRSPNRADAVVYGNWVRPRTRPLPPLPADADTKSLGFVLDEFGKRRAKRVDDLVRERATGQPSGYLPQAPAANARWWDGWGRR